MERAFWPATSAFLPTFSSSSRQMTGAVVRLYYSTFCDDFPLVGQAILPAAAFQAAPWLPRSCFCINSTLMSSRAATISWWDRRFRLSSPAVGRRFWLRLCCSVQSIILFAACDDFEPGCFWTAIRLRLALWGRLFNLQPIVNRPTWAKPMRREAGYQSAAGCHLAPPELPLSVW